ncbi:FecR family protein [Novosphingobium kaempferiae]|uniref:FecR family protein n=1 Tax=Novosphingobium kaempferiae TaxID=2896849 RepID=UPI001E36422F|nr:FecR family protein [Novosphingobium kaempferiae]
MSADLPTLEALEKLGPTKAAAFWLERLDRVEDDEDSPLFHRWLTASEENRAAWDDALDVWDSFDEADMDGELEAMRREALSFRPRGLSAPWFRYAAASLAVIASTALLWHMGTFDGREPVPYVARAERADLYSFGLPDYTTAVGQRRTIGLSDGSRVTLDTDTAIDIAYLPDKRLIRLVRGQAFFAVRHDATRPFRVAAGERIVSVLGTSFNVRVSPEETRVVLVEGAVAVSKGSDPAQPDAVFEHLSPGQELIAHLGDDDHIHNADLGSGLGWREGFLQFDGDPLGKVVAELNRYTPQKLLVRDPWVADLRISGAFPTGDTDRFIQTLGAIYPVRVIPAAGGELEIIRKR